jgi:hypothetical protein
MELIVFLDNLSRSILGEHLSDKTTKTKLAVKNPVILDIVPNPQTNQLQLRMIPVLFKEFQAAKDEDVIWYFNRDTITENESFELEFRIKAQYQQMFSNIILPNTGAGNVAPSTAQPAAPSNVVKLFDE